jgi:hypothetical protein
VIEPYRRKIFSEALDSRDGRGHPKHNLILCSRGKKNWKSGDLVLAALYRLLAWESPGGSQCFLLANDEGQAADDLELAVKLVKANPPVKAAVRIKQKEIARRDGRGNLLILPAKDIAGAHGKTYLFCGFDEIHEYRTWDLLEAMQLDPTRPDSMMWVASYASLHHRPGVPLYDLFQRGKAGTDPRMFLSWYAADFTTDPAYQDVAPEDRANPSRPSWEEPDYLEQQRRRLPTVRFRRLHLNLPGYPDGGAFDAVKLDAAVEGGTRVRPPQPEVKYVAYVDMSGGSSDAAVLAVGHREGTRRVVDGIWDQGVRPPFNPKEAIPRFARILQAYRIGAVMGDTFGKEMLGFDAGFAACGIAYRPSPFSASELYELMEVPLNAGELSLPDDPETLEQFAGLQRRGLKITHRAGEHDDRANAVAGLAWLLGRDARPLPPGAIAVQGQRASAAPPGVWSSAPSPWSLVRGGSVFDAFDEGRLAGQAGAGGRRV